ncbi:hypothetical protein EZV62_006586 [Acer yangbiense]|uniref:Uncharacterized protein n=1 Tax=Acer yangbiense TaxID=1000413 RepID=A0A5C7I824_9ROSI|nr:hypothetical protein EZV62_006586 [Acer yangbiense]
MAESAIPVATEIAKYLVPPVERRFSYLWNYKTNLDNLEKEVDKLKADRDSVQLLIKPGEDPLPNVKLWQERTDRSIVEVSKVVGDNPEQANIHCCKGFSCPNLINRYQRGKNAAEKLKEVLKLEQEAAQWLAQISNRTNIPDDPWLRSGDGYEAFDSRSSVLKNIIDALRDPDVNMVGIYGMGGIGKTTLARKVAKHIQQENPSHVIVSVEVSTTPNIKNIQQAIGGKLGLKFHDETEDGQARALYGQLKKEVTVSEGADNSGEKKKEKKILLILDNIWGKIDLEKVGIPLGGDCKGLKLLLTTRSIHVLTNQMNSHCNFSVETLEEAEAWSLFKSIAGMCVDHPDLKNIAPKVAKECGNMPLAIVTIASALKDKEESTWSTALNELKNPSLEGFEATMTREVYTCIKFSYDHLDTKEHKEIFLLCSRMGCTYDASIQDLFMYGLGLGYFKRSNTLEEAQCKVEDLVKKLKGNSLLLDAPNETRESLRHVIPDGERFAMHDVICDVARSIDRQKGNVCNVIDDAISCRWAKTNILKNCTSITLHNISEVPKDLRLELPQLEFFYMKTKDSFSKIVDDFFVEMPSLLVLHLIEMNLSPLPTSLSNLTNLQTLCLDACKLGDIADIGKLEKLEILSFRGSKIKKLSKEMRRLTSIRLLDLTDCSTLEIIPPDVISSSFTQLEALYMYNTLITWEGRGLNIGRILDELKHLRDRLTTLEISIPNVKMSEGLLSPQLKRYKISIDRNWISPPKNSRTLRVGLNTNDNADEVISQLKGIKQLELGCADRRYGFTADSKQSVSLDALFSLESLSLQDLYFEKICNVPLAAGSFCQLRTITVYSCHKLTNIFSFSIDRVLPKLQEIRVSDCKNMEGIFAIEREDDVNNSELIHEIQFSQLCSVTLRDLPQLKSFCHRVKTTSQLQLTSSTNDGEIILEDMIDIPKSIFNEKVVFPNLENLHISDISVEKIWHNQLPTMSSSFHNLNRLYLHRCHNLIELFPSSMVNSFVQLQYLEIYKCSLLEEGVFMEELKEEERKDIQFPFLKEMTITKCHNLKGFISNDKELAGQVLVQVWDGADLMWGSGAVGMNFEVWTVGPQPLLEKKMVADGVSHAKPNQRWSESVAVPNIEELRIYGMENLEKIWHNQLVKDSFCKLKSLEVYDCKKLLNVFPSNICGSLLNLQELRVSYCRGLKNLFSASILAKEGVVMEEAPARFLFPKLTSLQLFCLPELRSFYPGRHKVEWHVLKSLDLFKVEGQPLFLSLVEEAFPCLEELDLDGKYVKMLWQGQVPESLFDSLKFLKSGMMNREFCHLISFKDNPSTSFQNLTSLQVMSCNSLINMGTSTVAKSLVQLTEMSISSCEKLTEVIGNHGDVIEDEIIFRKLKSLDLLGLPSLTSFYSLNCTLKFPSLETLTVTRCPNLKIFSLGDLTTEKLQEVKIDWESVELRPDFNLNTAIQQSYEKANSAKDNGASSSHHFEIDQESIQQSDEEAIQQSHEEANEDYSASSSDHSE